MRKTTQTALAIWLLTGLSAPALALDFETKCNDVTPTVCNDVVPIVQKYLNRYPEAVFLPLVIQIAHLHIFFITNDDPDDALRLLNGLAGMSDIFCQVSTEDSLVMDFRTNSGADGIYLQRTVTCHK